MHPFTVRAITLLPAADTVKVRLQTQPTTNPIYSEWPGALSMLLLARNCRILTAMPAWWQPPHSPRCSAPAACSCSAPAFDEMNSAPVPLFAGGAIDCFRKTLQWEGVPGLYKGVTSPLAGQVRGCGGEGRVHAPRAAQH